ncbi:hypothetical protein HPB50_020277 [Hyalomma asiaticum]|uniref:Uncharacterized protein n=1 Tax=Hyalomma asiaticum TaxID=266040 RepID=A0ACB7RNI6_HYAAI|nr:hypothetical protein HPB50_020277 [Hyalomma asiaticum]
MVIDEDGADSLLRDHNRIRLMFQNGFHKCRAEPPTTPGRPSEKALQQMAAKLVEHADLIESSEQLVKDSRKVLTQWVT